MVINYLLICLMCIPLMTGLAILATAEDMMKSENKFYNRKFACVYSYSVEQWVHFSI